MSTPELGASVIVSPSGMYHLRSRGLDARPRCSHYAHVPLAAAFPGSGWHASPLAWEQVLGDAQFHGTPPTARKRGQCRVCNDCWMGRWEKRAAPGVP